MMLRDMSCNKSHQLKLRSKQIHCRHIECNGERDYICTEKIHNNSIYITIMGIVSKMTKS